MSPGDAMWSRYGKLLQSRPLTTKALTSAGITGAGDLSCQLLIEEAEVRPRPCALLSHASVTRDPRPTLAAICTVHWACRGRRHSRLGAPARVRMFSGDMGPSGSMRCQLYSTQSA